MRFIEGGPDIPNELLEARDNGEVVFLCGAGVSMPVGLPSFQRLTEAVCATLSADFEMQMLQTDTPYDQVFSKLKRDFGNQAVLDAVFKETRTNAANHGPPTVNTCEQ